MRKILLLLWFMLPVLGGAYHYGPGQERLIVDDAAQYLAEADTFVAEKKWAEAAEKYDAALEILPDEQVNTIRRVRLERAKAQMQVKKLPIAHRDLLSLVDDMQGDKQADKELLDEARGALANSQFYMTWLMRLEGQPKEIWEPQIESARQTYRLLAEAQTKAGKNTAAKKSQEDLESAVKLARMELSDLQGLPLPSQ